MDYKATKTVIPQTCLGLHIAESRSQIYAQKWLAATSFDSTYDNQQRQLEICKPYSITLGKVDLNRQWSASCGMNIFSHNTMRSL